MKALFKISIIALLIGHSIYSNKGASLKFVNSSGQHIESALISVSGQSCKVKKLGIGGEINCFFKDLYDGSYSVSVSLQGGAVYSEPSLGYVTGGMDFQDTITINQSGEIELVSIPST
jgi:hypothetical protein